MLPVKRHRGEPGHTRDKVLPVPVQYTVANSFAEFGFLPTPPLCGEGRVAAQLRLVNGMQLPAARPAS